MTEKRPVPTEGSEKKELNFVTCPTHGVRYPEGGSCPRCEAARHGT